MCSGMVIRRDEGFLLMRTTTWLAIGWTLLILVLCWTPPRHLPASETAPSLFKFAHADKVIHAAIFAGFALLWRRATAPSSALVIAVSGFALAIITELGQATPIVGRDADLWDGLADGVGVAIGLAAAAWLFRRPMASITNQV